MFVKLFTQILDSSIADNRRLRHFFTDLLLCADSKGYVVMTDSAIARRIGCDIEEVRWGLEELAKPDPMSKTPDAEGARIERLDGTGYGWRIINYESYRAMKDADQMREATKERVRRFREKNRPVTPSNAAVTVGNANTEAEGEAKADTDSDPFKDKVQLLSVKPDEYPPIVENLWKLFPPNSRLRSSKFKLHEQWRKLKAKPDEQTVTESLVKWASCHEWTKDGGQFAPGAHLWLKDRKWESEPISANVPNQFRGTNEALSLKIL
jgi:hypothetical protein